MWNKSVLLSLIISGLIAQNNSFNFQTNGPNEDFVTIQHDDGYPQIRRTSGMRLDAWVKPTEDPAAYDMNGIISYLTLQGATTESGFAFIFKEGKIVINKEKITNTFKSKLPSLKSNSVGLQGWQPTAPETGEREMGRRARKTNLIINIK